MNANDIKKMMEAYLEVVSEKKLDPVNDKENDKKFKDRKDKDIDNDGDVDSSDEYLHKKRAATDDAIDGGDKPADNAKDDSEPVDKDKEDDNKKKKPAKTPEISKIGEKATTKEDVDIDEFLARLAEDFTEEQLDEISQGLAKKAFDARARRISDLEKEKDRETNKHGRAQIDKEIGSQDKKLARSHSKSGSDKPLNKSYDDANKEKDTRSPAQKYADYRKDGGKLDRDAFMKRQRESVDFGLSTNEFLNALEEAAKPVAKPAEGEKIDDKESPKSKEFKAKHKVQSHDHEDMEKVEEPKERSVKKEETDTRTYQQKIMDILSGKTWGEVQDSIDELKSTKE